MHHCMLLVLVLVLIIYTTLSMPEGSLARVWCVTYHITSYTHHSNHPATARRALLQVHHLVMPRLSLALLCLAGRLLLALQLPLHLPAEGQVRLSVQEDLEGPLLLTREPERQHEALPGGDALYAMCVLRP